LRLVGGAAMHDLPFYKPDAAASYAVQDIFVTVPTRQAMRERTIDFVPINTARWPGDFVAGTRPLDVYLASVSPPDEHGYCSFGFMLWASLELVEAAKMVIAEVDEEHIVTYGDNYVHVSQIDYLVEKTAATTLGDVASVMGYEAPSEVDLQIAQHAAALIRDGDTLQIGAGTVSMAVIEHLKEKNDLGLHSEICPTGVAPLIAAGNINGSRKTLDPRRAICTALMGDEFTLDFAHRNPAIELRRMSYTNHPRVIAQHDHMVAGR
jgi:4-hydroxybutyrate CoA-transferase